MNKNFINPNDWVSIPQAAKLHGKSRQAMEKLIKKGRFRTLFIGGHTLVFRHDIEQFKPAPAGRPLTSKIRERNRKKASTDPAKKR